MKWITPLISPPSSVAPIIENKNTIKILKRPNSKVKASLKIKAVYNLCNTCNC